MWFEFSAEITEEIEMAEKGNIPIQFYNLKAGCYQGIHTCEGNMIVIINALADYADIMQEYIRQEGDNFLGYKKAFYELHAERCRKIGKQLESQIGYDRDATIEKCKKKHGYLGDDDGGSNSDIGEDAMVLALRKNKKKKGESHEQ